MQNNLIHKEGKIKANALKLANFSFLFLAFIFLISFSSASMQVGIDGSLDEIGINFDRTPFNISERTINDSLLWDGFAWDIDRWLLIDGSNANTDIDIGSNDFSAKNGFFEFDLELSGNGNQAFLISTDTATSYSRITLKETDEELARLTFYGARFAGTQAGIAKSNLTLFMSEVSNDDGGMMIGTKNENPLYFITDNIVRMIIDKVGDTYINGSLFPSSSLTFDIGSGANRWLNLYVQNINAEEIETYNIHVLQNLTVDGNVTMTGEINGVNISDLDNQYLNLSGGNANQNINIGAYNLTASYFNGQFNWTTGDTWNSFDGTTLTFNDSRLSTIFYNVTAIDVVTGTGAGVLSNIQAYDQISYNVSEDASDLELRVNFSVGVGGDFNQLIIRYKSGEEDEPHRLQIQIYDVDENEWENYGDLPENNEYNIVQFGVFDANEHINDEGIVQVRFFQDEGVPPKTHLHQFDWVTISKGLGTPAGQEVDPKSIHKDGSTMWGGNEQGNGFNSTGWDWITADTANFSMLYVGGANIADTYYLKSNPYSFYNSTTLGIDYYNKTQINSFSYYNATDFDIADYYSSADIDGFSYYNSTDFDIADYFTKTNILDFGFYNSTNPQTETDPLWSDNFTLYNSSWSSTYNATYDAYNSSGLIINWSGDYIETELDPLAYNGTLAYLSDILGWSYYNSTDFDITDYFTKTNILDFGFYNSTNPQTETDPLWSANFTLYNASWSSAYNATYDTAIADHPHQDVQTTASPEFVDVTIGEKLTHVGDADTYLEFDTNRIKLVAGGEQVFYGDDVYVEIGSFLNNVNVHIVGNLRNAMVYNWGDDVFTFHSPIVSTENITTEADISAINVIASIFKDKSLRAYYQFNKNLLDSSTYENDGTVGASSPNTNYDILTINGNDAVRLPESNVLFPNNDTWTVGLWFKRISGSDITVNQELFMAKRAPLDEGGSGLEIRLEQASDKLDVRFRENGGWGTILYGSDLSALGTDWHHIVLTYDGNIFRLYEDGNEIDTVTEAFAGFGSGDAIIGAKTIPAFGSFFAGDIDNVMIFDRTLTPQEIYDIYSIQNKRFGYFNFLTTNNLAVSEITTNLIPTFGVLDIGSSGEPWDELFVDDIIVRGITGTANWYTSGRIYSGSDMYTTGAGDDFWLGTFTQASANFRAYANGDLIAEKIALGSNTLGGLSSGDINVSTIYYDTLTPKSASPTIITFELPNDLLLVKEIGKGWVECNSKKGECSVEVENKMKKIYEERESERVCRLNDYSWDGSCYEIIKEIIRFEDATKTIQVNVTEIINSTCKELDNELRAVEYNCEKIIELDKLEDKIVFEENCDWDGNYYCNVRNEVEL